MTTLVSGILPFGTVFIELYFIMSSLWLHEVYYVFGFLFIVSLLTIIVCAEVRSRSRGGNRGDATGGCRGGRRLPLRVPFDDENR